MSCMVYLPRDRYTTAGPPAMEAILLDAFGGVSIDYTARVSESVLARLHFVVRVDAGRRRCPTSTPPSVEARLVAGDPVLGRRLRRRAAGQLWRRGGVRRLAERRTPTRFPEAYKEDLPRRRAVVRPAPARGARRPSGDIDLQPLRAGRRGTRRAAAQALPRRPAGVACPRPAAAAARWASRSSTSGRTRSSEPDGPRAWVYDFGLRYEPSGELPGDDAREPVPGRLRGCLGGRGRERRLQRLVLRAGLTWRQARCCAPTPSTCGRPARRSARTTSRSA